MKTVKMLMIVLACSLALTSCYTHIHTVGQGAQGSNISTQKQWYALWGLVPINEVDSKSMASGSDDYTVKTEATFVDGIISAFAGIVTISVQTVEVKK